MSRLSHTELAAAHGRADWTLLWQHAIPLVKLTVGRMARGESIRREDADDDLLQEGMLIAGKAMRTWDPIECAYSTHITTWVRGELQNYLNEKRNGGIGGRDQAPTVLSISDQRDDAPISDDDEPEDDGTFEAALSYDGVVKPGGQFDGIGVVPEGYEQTDAEADREFRKRVVRAAVAGLRDDDEREALERIYGLNGRPEHPKTYAARKGVTQRTISNRVDAAIRKISKRLPKSFS